MKTVASIIATVFLILYFLSNYLEKELTKITIIEINIKYYIKKVGIRKYSETKRYKQNFNGSLAIMEK